MADRGSDILVSFRDHPWSYEEAREKGLERAWGLDAVDGDTVDLIVDPGYRLRPKTRHRLRGVDTAETFGVKKETAEFEAGKRAERRTRELVRGQPLLVRSGKDTGKYGRWISTVYVNVGEGTVGRDLSEVLRTEGHEREESIAAVEAERAAADEGTDGEVEG